MLILVGAVIVLGSVVGGYLMAGGAMGVLVQPAEFVVIGGAAVGSLLISTPPKVLKLTVAQIKGALGSGTGKEEYVELLSMLYLIFKQVQQSGVMSLEAHFEDPQKSSILSRFPRFLARHEAVDFLADSAKVIIVGGIAAHDLEALMDEDLKVHHEEALKPSSALAKIGDALPGLGIVAAVLGVVVTMGALGGPPEEIGHKVAAALVGTFLGILLCYGLFGPLAGSMAKINDAESQYYHCLRVAVISFIKGSPPIIAIEFGRRTIPSACRPTFTEMEKTCKGAQVAAPPAA